MAVNKSGLTITNAPVTFSNDEGTPLIFPEQVRGGLANYTTTERDGIDGRILDNNMIIYNTTTDRYEIYTSGTRNSSGFMTGGTWSGLELGGGIAQYETGHDYVEGDIIWYATDNRIYRATSDVTNAPATLNASDWQNLSSTTVDTDDLEDEAVTEVKLNISNDPVDNYVLTASADGTMTWNSVGTEHLEDGEVTYPKTDLDGTGNGGDVLRLNADGDNWEWTHIDDDGAVILNIQNTHTYTVRATINSSSNTRQVLRFQQDVADFNSITLHVANTDLDFYTAGSYLIYYDETNDDPNNYELTFRIDSRTLVSGTPLDQYQTWRFDGTVVDFVGFEGQVLSGADTKPAAISSATKRPVIFEFKGATIHNSGYPGYVPAPSNRTDVLKGDGTWGQVVTASIDDNAVTYGKIDITGSGYDFMRLNSDGDNWEFYTLGGDVAINDNGAMRLQPGSIRYDELSRTTSTPNQVLVSTGTNWEWKHLIDFDAADIGYFRGEFYTGPEGQNYTYRSNPIEINGDTDFAVVEVGDGYRLEFNPNAGDSFWADQGPFGSYMRIYDGTNSGFYAILDAEYTDNFFRLSNVVSGTDVIANVSDNTSGFGFGLSQAFPINRFGILDDAINVDKLADNAVQIGKIDQDIPSDADGNKVYYLGTNSDGDDWQWSVVDSKGDVANAIAVNSNTGSFAEAPNADAGNAIAIGDNSEASSYGAIAIGTDNTASGSESTAIGHQSNAEHDNSSAFGRRANTAIEHEVRLGGSIQHVTVHPQQAGTESLPNQLATKQYVDNRVAAGHAIVIDGELANTLKSEAPGVVNNDIFENYRENLDWRGGLIRSMTADEPKYLSVFNGFGTSANEITNAAMFPYDGGDDEPWTRVFGNTVDIEHDGVLLDDLSELSAVELWRWDGNDGAQIWCQDAVNLSVSMSLMVITDGDDAIDWGSFTHRGQLQLCHITNSDSYIGEATVIASSPVAEFQYSGNGVVSAGDHFVGYEVPIFDRTLFTVTPVNAENAYVNVQNGDYIFWRMKFTTNGDLGVGASDTSGFNRSDFGFFFNYDYRNSNDSNADLNTYSLEFDALYPAQTYELTLQSDGQLVWVDIDGDDANERTLFDPNSRTIPLDTLDHPSTAGSYQLDVDGDGTVTWQQGQADQYFAVDTTDTNLAASASGTDSVSLGPDAQASGNNSVGIGTSTRANNTDTVAIGDGASATAANTVSIGRNVRGGHEDCVLLGKDATSDANGQFIVKGVSEIHFPDVTGGGDNQFLAIDANGAVTVDVPDMGITQWSAGTYNAGDVVWYQPNNKIYRATGTTTLEPSLAGAGNIWIELSPSDAAMLIGDFSHTMSYVDNDTVVFVSQLYRANTSVDALPTWAAADSYDVGDFVVSNILVYKNLTGNNGVNAPGSDSTNWEQTDELDPDNSSDWDLIGAENVYVDVNATGDAASAQGTAAIAIGENATVTSHGTFAMAIGKDSVAGGSSSGVGQASVAIGYRAYATANGAVAIGPSLVSTDTTEASGISSVAIGQRSTSSGYKSVALGDFASAAHDSASALGHYATTSKDDEVMVGAHVTTEGSNNFTNTVGFIGLSDAIEREEAFLWNSMATRQDLGMIYNDSIGSSDTNQMARWNFEQFDRLDIGNVVTTGNDPDVPAISYYVASQSAIRGYAEGLPSRIVKSYSFRASGGSADGFIVKTFAYNSDGLPDNIFIYWIPGDYDSDQRDNLFGTSSLTQTWGFLSDDNQYTPVDEGFFTSGHFQDGGWRGFDSSHVSSGENVQLLGHQFIQYDTDSNPLGSRYYGRSLN